MEYVITNYNYTFGNARISRFWSANPNFQAVLKQAFSKKVVFGSALYLVLRRDGGLYRGPLGERETH